MKNFSNIFSALVALLLISSMAFAQNDNNVGIGTTTPEPAAILHIESPAFPAPVKGVLVPRMGNIERDQMEGQYGDELPDGLLIYNEDDGNFWFYRHDDPAPQNPPYGQWVMINASTQTQNSNVPQGGIMMWSGTIASIPTGWALCNGANGTPDLTDKFIVSVASAAENPGTAPVANEYVQVQNGSPTAPQRRFFKLAYIMKL
jgi:hypothetical protein